MKYLSLTFLVVSLSSLVYSQDVWRDIPVNPNCTSIVYDIEMLDGKIYQCYSQNISGTDKLNVDVYNPSSQTWTMLTAVPQVLYSKLKTEKIGNTIYIVGYDGSNFFINYLNGLTASTSTISIVSNPYQFNAVNDNWEFHAGNNSDELYVLFTTGTGPSDVHGIEFINGGTPQTSTWGYMTEASSQNLSLADLQIQSSATDVYFGVYSNKIRMTRFVKGAINIMYAYDGLLGEVNSNGSVWDNSGFVIAGNKVDMPTFYGTEDFNNLSYEVPIDGNTIDVNLASTTTDFNLNSQFLAKEQSPSYSFIMSMFSDNGLGNPNDKLFVIRRDFSQVGTTWDTLASRILSKGTVVDTNSFRLSIDNAYHHVAAGYTVSGNSFSEIKVSNKDPYLLAGSANPNSGLCANQMNEIYSNIEIMDDDYELVQIISATSVNSQTSNIQFIPNGFSNGISKFKIIGIPNTLSDQIQIQYTDGFYTYTAVLNTYNGNTTPVNVQFVANPVLFCSNEVQLDLSDKVNYYDQGTFRLNGTDLIGTLINAPVLNSIANTGTLSYIVNVNGCIIRTNGTYQIVDAPSASIVSNPSTCALNNGDATLTIVQGTSSNTNFYWSTGESTLSIANLEPGAYYAHVEDDNGCKATALASILASDVTINQSITNLSCFGKNDGSIDLSITSSVTYKIIWSTGKVAEDLANLSAGNYEYSYYGADGCELQKSITVTSPNQLLNSFVVNRPDCNVSNGSILANISGGSGSGTYTYTWSNAVTSAFNNNLQRGYYELTVTDANSCILKDSLFLNDNYGTILIDSLILPACDLNNGGINLTLVDNPSGGPVNSIVWDNGGTTEDIYNLSSGTYMVTVNSGTNCITQKAYNLPVRPPLRNDICVVTVDSATTTNLVVWEKLEPQGISHYNIYRENLEAGDYMLIDTVQYASLSVFNDVVASPLIRSWRYRISAVNTCGVEGPLSAQHKTLHLNTINQVTPGNVDIYWDNYEGIYSGNYVCNRYTDQNGWEVLTPTIPFGSPTVFSDSPGTGLTGWDYFVDLDLQTPCQATWRAQDFNRTRSNKEKGVFNPAGTNTTYSNNGINTLNSSDFSARIYPNPFDEILHFELFGQKSAQVEITDLQGKIISVFSLNEGKSHISTNNLQSGVYFIQMKANDARKTFKLVK